MHARISLTGVLFAVNAWAQLQPLLAPDACYPACNYAAAAYQSLGQISSVLCATNGVFVVAYNSLTDCIIDNANDAGKTSVSNLNAPRSICGLTAAPAVSAVATTAAASATPAQPTSAVAPSTAAASATVVSSTTAAAPVPSSSYLSSVAQLSSTLGTDASISSSLSRRLSSVLSSLSAASSQSSTSTSAAGLSGGSGSRTTSTATSSTSLSAIESHSTLGKGAIAGIAVGAVIAILVALALIFLLVRRRRKQAKQRESALALSRTEQRPPEKAQLDSTEYHPHREELEGSAGMRKARHLAGIHELAYSPTTDSSEMSANEIAAKEMLADSNFRR